ncbi:MFS transporter [Microbacterium maritypicum]|uniref:MFS transporter n=1 Tax=Microbacterium TaxID=33882 RepID=UPI0004939E77|nr:MULTISPECIES: MFS transporter [Microbacterium]MCV0336020.1 MFS transporter [Microbacterium sp.]MCV0377151.1 MFS transporter [Microbacterium sp.]MCV0390868.1 MFS transporter [Microbacterium sp.]MCV0419581.1 MFS transporter [Microbacterium sp.]MCV0422708.1 MFS transporter [Microbacterium sp.]
MTTVTAPHRLWRNTRYLTWLVSDTSKGLAASLFGFAIPLLALIVTNDPAQAGIIGGAGMVARLLMTLAGGVLADRHRRIALMLLGSLIGIVLAGGFTLLALGDAMTFGSLLVIDVLLAARSGLFDVAGESAIKEIVPDDAMGRAQAANQGRDAALQLAGGPLGGLLLGVGGWLVGVVMTLCHAIAALTAWMLGRQVRRAGMIDTGADDVAEPSTVVEPGVAVKPNAWAELREGFGWLLSRPDLGGVLLITTVINLGFNATITTIIYALQQDGYSELLIGTLSASIGAVMLVGAVCAPLLVPRIKAGVLTIAGLTVVSIGAIALSMVTDPWAIAVVLGASVLLIPALNAGMMGYFMVATPSHLLGRANSAAGVLGMGAMPLAPLIAGFGLAWIGREWTILICAALCLISVVLAVSNRALRALPVESGWAAHAKQYETV